MHSPQAARALETPIAWRPSPAAGDPASSAVGGGPSEGPVGFWCAGFMANRRELRAACGLPAAATAAELLAALYRQSGPDCARRIHGPFAWVAVDPVRRELVAARDRAGIQGIYYATTGEELIVGERVGPLRQRLERPGELNLRSLVAQLHGFAPLADETCFAGVRALPPGSLLRASPAGVRVERYWRLEPGRELRLGSDEQYAEALRELLFRVISEYRPSAPCAATLSSGLDSTSVAAGLAAAAGPAPTRLYTFGMAELPESDESAGAAAVAAHLGQPLEVIPSSNRWPTSGWDTLRLLEEGTVVTYQELWDELYRRMRQRGLRVVFTGVSGDHLLGGTGVLVYPDLLLSGRWLRLARGLREHRHSSGASLPGLLWSQLVRPLARALLPQRWAVARERMPWLRRRFHRALLESRPAAPRRWRRLPGRRLRLAALQDPMLSFGSSLASLRAMAEGVELRHPLTDHRLLEFAAALPLDQCLRSGVPKWVLRNAMRGHLPRQILEARERVYPLALFSRGLKERGEARIRELITDMRAAEIGLVDELELQRAYRRYLEGPATTLFWHTLTLEAWLRRYA